MKPLEQLIIASNSLDYFEQKQLNKEYVPPFRISAAHELFIKSLDDVCKILYFCKKIDKELNSKLLISRMDLPNWTSIRPFEFYLTQLKEKFIIFRTILSTMFKIGRSKIIYNIIDRWSYEIAENSDFMGSLNDLIKIDNKCEEVMGNSLKRDQLKFLYESIRPLYESPVKLWLFPDEDLIPDSTEAQEQEDILRYIKRDIISPITAFRSLVYMHQIDVRKKEDDEEAEIAARLAAKKAQEEGEEESEISQEEINKEEILSPEAKAEKEREEKKVRQEAAEEKYGRYMLWEGIIPEDKYIQWSSSSEKIGGLNIHIIEDIQDYFITQTYKKDSKCEMELEKEKKKQEEEEKVKLQSENEEEKTIAKLNKRLEEYRPNNRIWNYFLEKDSTYFIKHKYRINADPRGIYEDGRVDDLMKDIEVLEVQLKTSNEEYWNNLIQYAYDILKDDFQKEQSNENEIS